MESYDKIPTPTELGQRIKRYHQYKEEKIDVTANEFCRVLFEDIEMCAQKESTKYKISFWIKTNNLQTSKQLLQSAKKILHPTWSLNYKWIKSDEDTESYESFDQLGLLDELNDACTIYELNANAITYHLYELEIQPFKLKYFIADECVICTEPMSKTSNMPYFKVCGHACICHRPKCREYYPKLTKCPMCRTESEIALTKKIKIKKKLFCKKA